MTNGEQIRLVSSRSPLPTAVPLSLPSDAPSPPSKRDLTSWWKQFTSKARKEESVRPTTGIFGVPLNVSIKYANVAISLTGEDGKSFVYGYVPIVVAKCGVFLKEKATDVEGIFRLSGSAKRIKDLQEIFNSPDRYGKGLDWTGYTVHDAANILRRYLNQLPEPIVPLEFYERFRDPLRPQQGVGKGEEEGQSELPPNFDREEVVATYQQLIKDLPPLNRQLLLYILDLLTVFASKSDLNRMTAGNLAAIFQPGLLSHPNHDMSPREYKISQDVLIFLIENQDNFLFGMTGTAADEETVKAMEAGAKTNVPKAGTGLRRSASNASGGADSLRKYEALRRNASVSSKHSRQSGGNLTSPTSPKSLSGFGVHRSNTVPSKRPPGLIPTTFNRSPQILAKSPGGASPPAVAPPAPQPENDPPPRDVKNNKPDMRIDIMPPAMKSDVEAQPQQNAVGPSLAEPVVTPNKERKLAALFAWPSPSDDGRAPNRLRKKRRIPGSSSESAHSSTHSLHDIGSPPPPIFRAAPDTDGEQSLVSTPKAPTVSTMAAVVGTPANRRSFEDQPGIDNTLKLPVSRTPSPSSTYVTDHSDMEHAEETTEKKEKRRSWRFHRHSRRAGKPASLSMSPPPVMGSHAGASFSNSSLASSTIHNQVGSADVPAAKESSVSTLQSHPSDAASGTGSQITSPVVSKEESVEERKGFFSKIKAKVAHVKDGRKEVDASRARSPPDSDNERSTRSSVPFFGREVKSPRGASFDLARDQSVPGARDKSPIPAAVPAASALPAESQPPVVSQPAQADLPANPDAVRVLSKVEEEPPSPQAESFKLEGLKEASELPAQPAVVPELREDAKNLTQESGQQEIKHAVASAPEAVADAATTKSSSEIPPKPVAGTFIEEITEGPIEPPAEIPPIPAAVLDAPTKPIEEAKPTEPVVPAPTEAQTNVAPEKAPETMPKETPVVILQAQAPEPLTTQVTEAEDKSLSTTPVPTSNVAP